MELQTGKALLVMMEMMSLIWKFRIGDAIPPLHQLYSVLQNVCTFLRRRMRIDRNNALARNYAEQFFLRSTLLCRNFVQEDLAFIVS